MDAAVPITITRITIAMATPNKGHDARLESVYFWARAFVCLFGLGAVAWGAVVLPEFREQAPLNRITSELLMGRAYKLQTLSDAATQVAAIEQSWFCSPSDFHDEVVLRVAILQSAIAAGDKASVDHAYTPLYDLANTALACSPADPFVWWTLFWIDAAKNGLTPKNANYLRLSYALGPNEGWIGLWRVQLALALFERLPKDLADDATDEFIRLVNTQVLYQEAAAIFSRATPAVQGRLVEQLKTANPVPRQIFARVLYDKGFDVNIAGVDRPARPWQ
jgi:hypothetical protein